MKRVHVHLSVQDLAKNIAFYQAFFHQKPTLEKTDYAKWILEEPAMNFSISTGSGPEGIQHLGIETDQNNQLQEMFGYMDKAVGPVLAEGETVCCYARSEKSWITDPQGVSWEVFQTFNQEEHFGEGKHARTGEEAAKDCCGPDCC